MKSYIVIAALSLIALAFPESGTACANLTKAGEKIKREREERYLQKESDKIVRGVWFAEKAEPDPENEYRGTGYIEVEKGKNKLRYRVSIPGEINCGFPYYYLKNGDEGRFYLKRDDHPDNKDIDDGFVDNFSYIHFKSLKRNDN